MNDNFDDILTRADTMPRIAQLLHVGASTLRDWKAMDARFPSPDAAGLYPVAAVIALAIIRDLERQSDFDFDMERQQGARGLIAQGWDYKLLHDIAAGKFTGQRQDAIGDMLGMLARYRGAQ